MDSLYFSTGKAARALGVNADAIRNLCSAGAVRAEVTEGGQWRVPAEEIERLKRDGLPPVPKPLPGQSKRTSQVPGPLTRPAQRRTSSRDDDGEDDEDFPYGDHDIGLLAEPSDETVQAADAVVRLRSEVEGLRLKKERELALDFFRDRTQAEAERQQADAEEEAGRIAEQEERERRRYLLDRWLEYALARIPWEAQGHVEVQLHGKIKAALANVDAYESDAVVERVVLGVVAALLRPWNRRKEIEQVIDEAVDELPYSAGNWAERAREAARAAAERAGPEASMSTVRGVVTDAVSTILADYHAARAAQADADARERMIQWASLQLARAYTEEGVELAVKAVKDAWAKLPVGTARAKLEEARDTALAPWRAAVAERAASQRAQAEAARNKQIAALAALFRTPAPTVQHRAPIVRRSPVSR
jgi:hypothetical protein